MSVWVGVDVGGKRKGFDVAVIDERSVLHLAGRLSGAEVREVVASWEPTLVAIDSPRCCAPPGAASRAGERALARSVCGIRWTPDHPAVLGGAYYGWIVEGLELYGKLDAAGIDVIEVFPTASWTRWYGKRDGRRRSVWSTEALATLELVGIPPRTNQDQRDAIGAAATARAHTLGETEAFGQIVVPARP